MRRLALACLVVLAGCVRSYPNRPLPPGVENGALYTYRDRPGRAAGDPFVVMSFSGGGVRATALAYSVLDELGHHAYTAANGERRSLLDDVQIVSSTSGGSVAAAWLALHGSGNRRAQLQPLRTDFIERRNMAAIAWKLANPLTWVKLALPGHSRVDLVREVFDDRLFHGATYADANGDGRPFAILNSTDMGSGVTFAFTPQYFDDICSDLGRLPLATAVAASTAVPIALTPVTLANHRGERCWTHEIPRTIGNSLANPYARYVNFEHFKLARYENALRKGPDAYGTVDYVHLVDGGLADNLGLRSLEQAVFSVNATIPFRLLVNRGGIGKFVVIVVNARAGGPGKLSRSGATPGILEMTASVAGDPINVVSDVADAEFRQMLGDLGSWARGDGGPLGAYLVEVDFDLLDSHDAAERDLRAAAKAVPTSWTISGEQFRTIDRAGRLLLTRSPCFKVLLADLGAAPEPSVSEDDRAACAARAPR
jgi:NTE family protein